MNARSFVSQFQRLIGKGRVLKGKSSRKQWPVIPPKAPKILIFAPHPDDECIVGGLALRLSREARWNVINVAVTLGSKKERRAARLLELQKACASLGFNLIVPRPHGFEGVNVELRKHNRTQWRAAVKAVTGIVTAHAPRLILIPHEKDHHPAHIGTHFLVLDALKRLPPDFHCCIAETEFWGQMKDPNLLVELGVDDVADLVSALTNHAGEVRRNPYHLRLPSWMIDNVRRGAELVDRPGAVAPGFTFGTIYRLSKWSKGRLVRVHPRQGFLSCAADLRKCFR